MTYMGESHRFRILMIYALFDEVGQGLGEGSGALEERAHAGAFGGLILVLFLRVHEALGLSEVEGLGHHSVDVGDFGGVGWIKRGWWLSGTGLGHLGANDWNKLTILHS